MSRKILVSGLSILATLGIVSAATFAYFNDVSASNNNTFSTGDLTLEISDVGESFTTGNVTATWGDSELFPGDTTPVGTLSMRNGGTVPAHHVDFNFTNTPSDGTNPLDRVMRVTTLEFDSTSLLTGLGASANTYGLIDTDANGFLELDELAAQDLDIHNLLLNDFLTHNLTMQLTMSPDAGNVYQTSNVTTEVTVTLNQGPTD